MNQDKLKQIKRLKSEIEQKLELIESLKRQGKEFKDIVKEVWELSKEKFLLQVDLKRNYKKYEGLIMTVGTTPQPIILSILANDPKGVFFIYTEKSEEYLDTINEEINLLEGQKRKRRVPKDSIMGTFRQIKQGLKFLHDEKGIAMKKIAMDSTGGTKLMSVTCGIAASMFDLDVLYVGSGRYSSTLRRPEPGTEKLIHFPNPNELLKNIKFIEDFELSKERVDQISKYFKDVTNTSIIFLVYSKSGVVLSKVDYLKNHDLDPDIFGGFLSAVDGWGINLSEILKLNTHGDGIKDAEIEINFQNFKITISYGEFTRIILISDESTGDLMKKKLQQLLKEYESKHFKDLKDFTGEITQFNDFPESAKNKLDLRLNEKSIINSDKIYKYKRNESLIYMLKEWYEKMKIEDATVSFYPAKIPEILIFQLDINLREARYWTYDLFNFNMIIPKKS